MAKISLGWTSEIPMSPPAAHRPRKPPGSERIATTKAKPAPDGTASSTSSDQHACLERTDPMDPPRLNFLAEARSPLNGDVPLGAAVPRLHPEERRRPSRGGGQNDDAGNPLRSRPP